MKQFIIFLSLIVTIFSFSGCAMVHQGPWKGKVIDAETKQPIEGAVVVAVWYVTSMGMGDTVDSFYDAKETVTDKDGNWDIPEYKIFFVRIGRGLHKPEFTIFKPGYGAFPRDQVEPKMNIQDAFLPNPVVDRVVVELPKLKTKKERRDTLVYLNYYSKEKTPNLFKLYDEECINLGIPGIK